MISMQKMKAPQNESLLFSAKLWKGHLLSLRRTIELWLVELVIEGSNSISIARESYSWDIQKLKGMDFLTIWSNTIHGTDFWLDDNGLWSRSLEDFFGDKQSTYFQITCQY